MFTGRECVHDTVARSSWPAYLILQSRRLESVLRPLRIFYLTTESEFFTFVILILLLASLPRPLANAPYLSVLQLSTTAVYTSHLLSIILIY